MLLSLTVEDLRTIATSLAEWDRLLFDKNGDYRERASLVRRVEVMRPEDTEVIGHFVLEDGWVGFQPITKEGTK